MKPQDHQSLLSTRNIVEVHVTHFGKSVEHGFVIFLQESWMIKTCTGSQEVQQLGKLKQFFNINNHNAHLVFQQSLNNFFEIFQNGSVIIT